MNEKPFFFSCNNYELFGVLHEPTHGPADTGFVFCHSFAEEKLWAHRVFVDFARKLSDLGYAVLRFDFMGHGDSDGQFEDSDIESQLRDVKAAITTLKKECASVEKVNLLGLRFGATLAALVVEEVPDINLLVLWDPIVDGSKFMQMALRMNLTTQMALYKKVKINREQLINNMKDGIPVNLDGYDLSYNYFQQATEINLLNGEKNFAGKCLIVQIAESDKPLHKDLLELSKSYQNAVVLNANEQQFWKEIKTFYERADNLSEVTLNWLNEQR